MLETDSLRKVLYTKAITAVNSLSLKCKIGEEAFVPPSDGSLYGEFWFRTTAGKQIELGGKGSYETTVGIVQFTIYAPEKSGDGPLLKMGDQLKNLFNRAQWRVPPDGYVNMHVMACQELPGISSGNKVAIIDGSFIYYHRNPNPSTLLDD